MGDTAVHLWHGDCLEVMGRMPDGSVDAVVTDPPYELGFMGKKWDATGIAYNITLWQECLRVLKPGGHLLAFGGTRTYHRMACAIEDAGFEVRDQLQWLYGSGFPKSRNIGGGMGTALKPANEPICMARKPLSESTVAVNVRAHGTGALNIDAGRIATEDSWEKRQVGPRLSTTYGGGRNTNPDGASHPEGRWPANVLFDEWAAAELDRQSGQGQSVGRAFVHRARPTQKSKGAETARVSFGHSDSGGASRFFYVAKPSQAEKNAGCDGLPSGANRVNAPRAEEAANFAASSANHHPTVKPVCLMAYLIALVTPPGGTVLDPFLGSGTTGVAAVQAGMGFIGIEQSAEYLDIARARIAAAQEARALSLFPDVERDGAGLPGPRPVSARKGRQRP